jgi:hypothetical protein
MAAERKLFPVLLRYFIGCPRAGLNGRIMHLLRFERMLSFAMLQDF